MNNNQLVLLLSLVLVFFSCEKDDPAPDSTVQIEQGQGVFILHEGAFNQGNASLGYLLYGSSTMENRLFEKVNNRPLGDVLQSMTVVDQTGYLVLNNSRTIEQINLESIALQHQLRVNHAPRYLLPTGSGEALISTIFSPWVLVVDMDPLALIDSINLGHWSEEMILYENDALIAATDHDKVYRIDPDARAVVDSFQVDQGVSSLAIDSKNQLWVLCTGNYLDIPASLHVVDLANGLTTKSWSFNLNEFPSKLRINDDIVYFLNGGLHRMPIDAIDLSASPWIAGFNYYGYGMDPNDGRIWMANPVDFQQKGSIDIFDSNGNMLESFTADLVPSDFRFF